MRACFASIRRIRLARRCWAHAAVNYSDTDPQISQLQRWCLNRTCRLSSSCWTAVCPRAPGLRRPPWHPDSTGYCRIICLGSWRRGQHCVWLGRVGALFVVQLLGRNLVALRGVVDLGYLAHMTEYLRSQFPDPCRSYHLANPYTSCWLSLEPTAHHHDPRDIKSTFFGHASTTILVRSIK